MVIHDQGGAVPVLLLDAQGTSGEADHQTQAVQAFVARFGGASLVPIAWATLGGDPTLLEALRNVRSTLPRSSDLRGWHITVTDPLDQLVRRLLAHHTFRSPVLIVFTGAPLDAFLRRDGVEAITDGPWSVSAGSLATMIHPARLLG